MPLEDPRLSLETFQAMRDLLFEHTGIALCPEKQTMVQSRLARRLRDLGLPDYGAYLARLSPGAQEWPHFINALTTNLTRFFREAHHFEALSAWLRDRPGVPPRIWSAGCSTGEEPYSIALVLRRDLGPGLGEILATDLDSSVLAVARRGLYARERLADLDPAWRELGFQAVAGEAEGSLQVRPEIRGRVAFEEQNLLTGLYPPPCSLDAVFCRNVLIYFERPTQRRIVGRLMESLRPGGLLLLGHSEAMLGLIPGLRILGGTTYQKE